MKLPNKQPKNSKICYHCGLMHSKVEAGGMFYCPNLMCEGPGNAWFRKQLDSYTETTGNYHTVDPDEWLDKAKIEIERDMEGQRCIIFDKGYVTDDNA